MEDKIINYKALGNKIQVRRRQLGMSQCEAAEVLDISTSFYSRLERGERVASLETLIKIANCFELSLDFLLQESLKHEKTNKLHTELLQLFIDKSPEQTERLINWLKMLSDNVDDL